MLLAGFAAFAKFTELVGFATFAKFAKPVARVNFVPQTSFASAAEFASFWFF